MFNSAGWVVIACLVLPFSYELLAMFVKDVAYVYISIDVPVFGVIVTGVMPHCRTTEQPTSFGIKTEHLNIK